MTTLPGEHHDIGRIVNTPEEFKSWVRENMATLIRSGRWFDKDAYKEILKFLKKTKRVCAIIPEDDVAVMETHLNRFMRVFEEQGHTVLRNRTLFDGIQILVGDSDDIEEVTPLKATAPAPAPPPVPTTQPTAPSMEESVRQKNKTEIYSLLLERIIAKAAIEGDQLLTKKTCTEKLKDALGLSTLERGPAALLRACLRRAAHASAPARASCLLRPHGCGSVRHSETSGPPWSAHGRTQTLWSGSVQVRKDCNDARPGPTGWMAVAQDWWRVQRSEPGGRRGPTACPNCTKHTCRLCRGDPAGPAGPF